MKFQVTIPPLTEDDFQMNVTVEGANWRTALRAALKKIGESAELVKNIECDVQDDGSFKITDIDTRRIFTIKEIAEAAADAQKQQEEAKRKQDEEAEKRRTQEAEESRRAELKREEDRRRDEDQRLLREQTVREEEQAAQKKATAEARRLEEEQQKRRDEESRRKLEDEDQRQRDEQKRKEDAQRAALEEQRRLEAQRKKDDEAKKQQEDEQRKKDAAQREATQRADEQKKREATSKATETQKLSRPKSKGETIETRLGQKLGGTDTVEFLSDAFDALGELFSISSPQKAVEFILEQAMRKAPSDAGSVFFNDVGKRQVSFWAARGPKSEKLLGKSIPYGKGIVGYCISKSVSLAIPDVSQDPRWDPAVSESIAFETRSVLCAPLYYEGRCYGALELLNRKSDSGFTRRELSVVNYLAEQLARWLHENGE